jgi:hypothetical protein
MTTRRTYTLEAKAYVTVKVNAADRGEARKKAERAILAVVCATDVTPTPRVEISLDDSGFQFEDRL